MSIRGRSLPAGWYPSDAAETRRMLRSFGEQVAVSRLDVPANAAIAPHAGWAYSGRCAWTAWSAAADADCAVVVGGHLPGGRGFLSAPADIMETPLGELRLDAELDTFVRDRLVAVPDRNVDNTVEVHLPMLKARFPDALVGWFRAPNGSEAAELGSCLAEYAKQTGKRIFVLGSTDLTHYGPSYGWSPAGGGAAGRTWAREADEAIVKAFTALDVEAAIRLARERAASCSVGAAIAAMTYAREMGRTSGVVLDMYSSADLAPGDSFVGYCSVAF
ncbi:MAG: AmmeMemoRadiSam system protein B [Spirochaetales bacterium]|nr:MAG: AmmeMemoRadiSam system protein B [Spirochaetales bacterium]